jgi:hypothetical protein
MAADDGRAPLGLCGGLWKRGSRDRGAGIRRTRNTQGWCACMLSSGGRQLQSRTRIKHHSCQHTNVLASFQQLATPGRLSRYRPVPGTHLALCMAPGENTPAGLCVLPTQLCSSLPPSSGSRGSPHLNKKYCSTRGATLSTRLMRSPSSKGTAEPAQQQQQQTTCHNASTAAARCYAPVSASWPTRCSAALNTSAADVTTISSHAALPQCKCHAISAASLT